MSGEKTETKPIPSRRVMVEDPAQLPADYSTTPGGTMFSTTPGGTRIVYERAFMKELRNSPVARTPPKNLPRIPGVTEPSPAKKSPKKSPLQRKSGDDTKDKPDDPQFEMDI